MEMCEDSESCFPCACIFRGHDWEFGTNEFGIYDFDNSFCIDAEPCQGKKEEDANACVSDETTCDPRYLEGVKLFDH